MYLSLLNTEQKKLFLSLAYNLVSSDGDFSEKERQAIKSYSVEMGMELKIEDVDTDLNRVIERINLICGAREKKIIIFEMVGLAMADYNFDDGERAIVRKTISIFDLDSAFGDYCENKLTEYFNLQNDLNARILS